MAVRNELNNESLVAGNSDKTEVGEVFVENQPHNSHNTDLEAKLNELQNQLKEEKEKAGKQYTQLLRAHAELENTRRRAQEDISKAHKFSIGYFAESLLPVKDSLEAALNQEKQTLETLQEGVSVTLKQLSAAFEKNNLKEIVPNPGDRFDPHYHQAISSVMASQPINTVVQNLQKGYMISDRTLRPALVILSQNSESNGNKSSTEANA